jgi:hypothetical protein
MRTQLNATRQLRATGNDWAELAYASSWTGRYLPGGTLVMRDVASSADVFGVNAAGQP